MSSHCDKVLFVIGLALVALTGSAALRCDWAGRIGGKSIWLSTEGVETATELPVLWGGSSPVPSALTRSADGRVTLTKSYSHPEHPDWAWTRTLSFVPGEGDSMECVFFETRANRPGKDVTATGTVSRLPPLPARPDLSAVKYGEPIDLLADGLDGFDVLDNGRASQWRFADGVLENGGSGANIRTKRGDFLDFKIGYDVRVDKDCNSGVYLRGIYELQVSDSFGKPVDSHNMAALYGRIVPSVSAEKPAGEWQHVEAILYRRHLTVTLNGVRIIDNAPIRGITGGALSADESAPGPIGLQGDHKGGAYRNLILTPIVREREERVDDSGSIVGADIVVIGGTQAGVEAALSARAAGADVVLFESRPVLGGDCAGKLLLEMKDGKPVEPLAMRKALDRKLADAGVVFRTWTYVKDVLRDDAGRVSGVTTVSRSGERVVSASCVIDATERAYAAKAAGSSFRSFPAGKYEVTRMVVSGEQPSAPGMSVTEVADMGKHAVGRPILDPAVREIDGRLWKCTARVEMRDGSPLEYARVENVMRDKTWTRLQLESAETCVIRAPDVLVEDAPGIITCGPLGKMDGATAGREAARRLSLPRQPFRRPEASVPRTSSYDMAVVGLGTGGAPAAIAGARLGLKTVGFEYTYRTGGLTTEGLIGVYWFGNRVGFTEEIDRALPGVGVVYSQAKEQYFRSEAVSAGATVVFGSFVYGVEKAGDRIVALKVMLADGAPALVPVKSVVDATGNCDVAVAAGEEAEFINGDELSLQGAAFMRKCLGQSYMNLDWTFVNDCDAEDLWYLSLRGRNSYEPDKGFWDQSQTIDTRERRRLRGLYRVTAQDVMLERTYPDIVCITRSNFDTHGQTVDPQFFIESPPHTPMNVNLPLRAMLPQKTSNLIVTGLGLSAARDAMPILRMQPDVQNQGWVAAEVCSQAVRENCAFGAIDIKALQNRLAARGIVPDWVLSARDSFPLPDERIDEMVRTLPDGYRNVVVAFAERSRSLPKLELAFAHATNDAERLVYAHVLGLLGSPVGAGALIGKLSGARWDEGWNYRGMGQFRRSVSWIDSYLIALGKTRDREAVPVVAALLGQLDATCAYSHFRAVSLACESIGDKRLARGLAQALRRPHIGGHAFAFSRVGAPAIPAYDVYGFKFGRNNPICHGAASIPDGERTACLRELCLVRALYRLGDVDGIGCETLRAYVRDPRKAYAKHAEAILEVK